MKTLTNHNKRICRKQKHNDRNFSASDDKHIDDNLSVNNKKWSTFKSMTFEESEKLYYSINYGKALQKQNAKYKAKRQYKYMKTVDDLLTSPNTAPMETLFYLGNHNDSANSKDIMKVFNKYIKWLQRTYGSNFHVLDLALHVDEPNSAPHIHMRSIIDYIDKDGLKKIGQDKGLEAMGIELPNQSAKKGKNNNRRMTFDKICRDKLIEICKTYDIEIIPGEGRGGLPHDDYKKNQETKKQREAEEKAYQENKAQQEAKLAKLHKEIDIAFQDKDIAEEEAKQAHANRRYEERKAQEYKDKADKEFERYTINKAIADKVQSKVDDFGQFFDMSYYDEQQKQKQQRSYNIETTR